MPKILLSLVLSIFFLPLAFSDIVESKVILSITKNQISYTVSFTSEDRVIEVLSEREIQNIRINKSRATFRRKVEGSLITYYIELPKSERFEIEFVYEYPFTREYRSRGIVVLSEVMRNLPYIVDLEGIANSSQLVIEADDSDEIDIVVDGKVVKRQNGSYITRTKNSLVVLGYLDVFEVSLNDSKVTIVLPKGNESVGLEIVSFIDRILKTIETKFELETPRDIKVIYYPYATFSENIGDTIIISKLLDQRRDYFSNIERIEDFVLLSHEILHMSIKQRIMPDAIDLVEGLIQYISIECLSEVLNSTYIRDVVFRNYLSQMKYLSLVKDKEILVRYRKYPLIYRYISGIVGEFQVVSFFKYLTKISEEISLDVIRRSFRSITGVSLDTFLPLFDGLATLPNLEIVKNQRSITVYSTAPTKVNTYLKVVFEDSETNISIEVPRNSSVSITFEQSIKNASVNFDGYFPELFYYDNSLESDAPSVVKQVVSEVLYILNTQDISQARNRKLIISKSLENRIKDYLSQKRKIFDSDEVRMGVENVVIYGGQVIVEVVIYSSTKYRQGFITISYR
ncbi:MAG: hypothetical protein N3D81_00170, partial [Spirochaetes bacterium]|nr:hypothetical protein [Spirochaetota bacterium]